MEDGHFELQLFEEAVGADGSKSFGELLRRGVGGESFHWLGVDERSPLAIALRLSGFRARTSTARFP